MDRVILVGGGALASDLVECFGRDVFAAVYVDPGLMSPSIAGLPVVDRWSAALQLSRKVMLAISDIGQRCRLLQQALAEGLESSPPMISPHAIVASSAQVGPGCVVAHHVVVGPFTRLLGHVLVMHGVVIGHDSVIHEQNVICAGASLSGGVVLESGCFIGPNASLAPRVQIAAGSFLAAGTVCLRSVSQRSVLIGNPARRAAHDGGNSVSMSGPW